MVLALAGTRPQGNSLNDGTLERLALGLVPHSHPGLDDVASMAARLRARIGLQLQPVTAFGVTFDRHPEGPAFALALSAGTVALRSTTVWTRDGGDLADLEPDDGQGVLFDLEGTRREITEWSRDSRARMVRSIAELDYSRWGDDGGVLALVTLTLPGDWERVAPTGRDFKRFIEVLRRRWARRIGPWRGLWKLEFQRRGAPHLHALMRVPAFVGVGPQRETFERWLSRTWAEIVAADDRDCYGCFGVVGGSCSITCDDSTHDGPCSGCVCVAPDTERARHLRAGTGLDFSGVRFSDPRRTAIYFLKHSAKTTDDKEYQHIVPEAWRGSGRGPGRFWGVWGLDRAVSELWISRTDFNRARRVLRRVARAAAARTELSRIRATTSSGSPERAQALRAMRRPRGPAGFRNAGGWLLVNDGLTTAYDLGRWLALVDR